MRESRVRFRGRENDDSEGCGRGSGTGGPVSPLHLVKFQWKFSLLRVTAAARFRKTRSTASRCNCRLQVPLVRATSTLHALPRSENNDFRSIRGDSGALFTIQQGLR